MNRNRMNKSKGKWIPEGANTTDIHPGGNVATVLFTIILNKTGWEMKKN